MPCRHPVWVAYMRSCHSAVLLSGLGGAPPASSLHMLPLAGYQACQDAAATVLRFAADTIPTELSVMCRDTNSPILRDLVAQSTGEAGAARAWPGARTC